MTPTSLFNRYLWLVELLSYKKRLTKQEIDQEWKESEVNDNQEETIPRRTFIRMKEAISKLFDLEICYSRIDGKYFIEENISDRRKATRQYLLEAFAVNQMMADNKDLQERIILEQAAAGSSNFLPEITMAMRNNRKIVITYQSHEMRKPQTFEIEPYVLRYFGKRWYVLARTDFHKDLRLYALDRMTDVKQSDAFFKLPSDFSADDFFSRYFGVIVMEGEAEIVRLKTTEKRAKYLRSLPLHHSQKETAPNVFEYYLIPAPDFVNALRAMSPEIEIVAPKWLRRQFYQEAKAQVAKYAVGKK